MLLNINRELTSSFFSPFRFESSCSGSQDVFSSWGGVTKYDDFTFRFTITSHFNFRLVGIPRILPLVPLEAAVMNSWSRSTRAALAPTRPLPCWDWASHCRALGEHLPAARHRHCASARACFRALHIAEFCTELERIDYHNHDDGTSATSWVDH